MNLADTKYIRNLIQLMGDSDLSEISIEQEQVKLTLKRERSLAPAIIPAVPTQVQMSSSQALPTQASAIISSSTIEPDSTPPADKNLHLITAPLVGTYYSASTPDTPPFIQKGDQITKGQTLCLVEAMKLMNEIESDVDGVVEGIFCENASPIEFGTKLFAIRLK